MLLFCFIIICIPVAVDVACAMLAELTNSCPFLSYLSSHQVDAMCCLHTNAPAGKGFKGCVGCIVNVIEDLEVDWESEDICDALKQTVSSPSPIPCVVTHRLARTHFSVALLVYRTLDHLY